MSWSSDGTTDNNTGGVFGRPTIGRRSWIEVFAMGSKKSPPRVFCRVFVLCAGDDLDDGYEGLANDGLFESFEADGVDGVFDDVEEELFVRRLGLPLLLGDFEEEPPLRALRFNDESFLEGFLFDPAEADADIDGMVAEFFIPILGASPSLLGIL